MSEINFNHIPVLLNECIEQLNIKKDGIYVDGTLGGAGHSTQILSRLSEKGKLIGIDQDIYALEYSTKLIKEKNFPATFEAVHGNFRNIDTLVEGKVDGVLLDIGVSSFQLDEAFRGFSYMKESALDMRMDNRNTLSAYQVVNEYSAERLTEVIKEYGEERYAGRIARAIVREREVEPIKTTTQLSDIIKRAMKKVSWNEDQHPAKRTFQAIRIEVNDELKALEQGLKKAFDKLNKGGRLCIITFHSLEDRIVKKAFADIVRKCDCPKEFPVCVCNKIVEGKLLYNKPTLPTKEEVEENARARSAKLRTIEKIV